MTQDLANLTDQALAAAKSAGADGADALAVSETSLSIAVREGALDQADRSEGVRLGLRVMVQGRQACISTSDIRAEALAEMSERAVAMAKVAPEDPYIRQAEPGAFATNVDATALDLFDPSDEPEAAQLQDRALAAETAAMGVDGVSQIQSAEAAFGASQFHLATSQGFSAGYSRTSHHIACVAVAGEGTSKVRDHDFDARIYNSDLRSATDIGTRAGERTVASLAPRKPPTGTFPVLYDERVSGTLIGHLLAASNGSSVARGATWLRDKLGQSVLPAGMDLVEEPHRARVGSSLPFDGEGLPTAKRSIVTDGVLQGWTMDMSTAARLGLESTASARRGTSAPPSPGVGNVRLTQGTQTRDALLRDMGTGLLLTSLIGSSINDTSGDYSRGAGGFWVENGEIQYAVSECTIAGNLLSMLATIVPANDARQHMSRPIPSLLVEGLTIAGA